MSYLYFACNWIINEDTVKYFDDVYRVAGEVGGEIGVLKSSQLTDEGYKYDVYGFRVPSQNALTKFIEQVGKQADLSDWSPINAEQYAVVEKRVTEQELAGLYMGYMMEHVPQNARVLATIEGRNPYVKPLEQLNLASNTIKVLKKHGILNIGDLLDSFERPEHYFAHIREADEQFMAEIAQSLDEAGYPAKEGGELLEALELGPRAYDALVHAGIVAVSQVLMTCPRLCTSLSERLCKLGRIDTGR